MARGGKRPSGRVSKGHKRRKKMSLNKRILKVIEANAEMKYWDLTISPEVIIAAGNEIGSMAIIAQGVKINERIGKEVRIKKIMCRLQVLLNTTAATSDTYDVLRVMIVLVKQHADVSTGLIERVLSTPSTIYSFNNLQNTGGMTTLWDRFITVNTTSGAFTSTVAGPHVELIEFFKDVDIPLIYAGATGALTENDVQSIQMLAWTIKGDITISGNLRLRYLDM